MNGRAIAICISCGAPLRYSLAGGFCDSRACQAHERARERANAHARRQRTAAMLLRSERESTHTRAYTYGYAR